jgi:hypothetical protein
MYPYLERVVRLERAIDQAIETLPSEMWGGDARSVAPNSVGNG